MRERDDLRNCDRCVWVQRIGRCASWDCEFIDKWAAAEAWRREKREELPSAEPKTGRWEYKPDPYGFFDSIPVCSECGCTTKMRETYPYCPNCGAKLDTVEVE